MQIGLSISPTLPRTPSGAPDYTLGDEELTNGSFTGNATGWTLSAFFYASNSILTLAAGTATQTLTADTVVADDVYEVVVAVAGADSADISFSLGGGDVEVLSTPADGTYTLVVTGGSANDDFLISTDDAAQIQNVSLKRRIPASGGSYDYEGDLTVGDNFGILRGYSSSIGALSPTTHEGETFTHVMSTTGVAFQVELSGDINGTGDIEVELGGFSGNPLTMSRVGVGTYQNSSEMSAIDTFFSAEVGNTIDLKITHL